jgi:hypothetical protein
MLANFSSQNTLSKELEGKIRRTKELWVRERPRVFAGFTAVAWTIMGALLGGDKVGCHREGL